MRSSKSGTDGRAWRVGKPVLLITVGVWLAARVTTAAPPTLSHLTPAGGERGSQVSLTLSGEFPWPVDVWAPGLGVKTGDEKGKLQITIPLDLPTDRAWLRLYNGEGISAAVPFLIGSLPEIMETEPNNSIESAQHISDPSTTVNGTLQEKGDVDGFAIPLEAGQTLIAAVTAHRLGSPMDAILQVSSGDGSVLAENHDDTGLDPRLAFTAADKGTYVVRMFAFPSTPDSTIAFRGDSSYVYRLTLTTGPFITHTVPLSVSQADVDTVEVGGWNIPPGTHLPVVPLGGSSMPEVQEFEAPGDQRVAPDDRLGLVFSPGFGGSARVRLVPHRARRNESPPTPMPTPMTLSPPNTVTGRLTSPDQCDEYVVPLKKHEHVVISVESVSLDLPLVPAVRFLDPSGAVVAEIGPAGPAQDALFTHTAEHDGDYRLCIRDRYRHGKERSYYRLTARFVEADFELLAGSDAVVAAPDQPGELKVAIKRTATTAGSVGPITLEALDLPAGVMAPQVVSEAEGSTSAEVTLCFTTDGSPFSGPIRIRGSADQPRKFERLVRTPARMGVAVEQIWLTAVARK
jgi:hypothetical protein